MEIALAERWIYSVLTADPLIGNEVYRDVAPETAGASFVTFSLAAPDDVTNANEERIFSSLSYTVKAVQEVQPGSLTPDSLIAKADRITTLLDRKQALVTGGEIIASVREGPVSFVEFEEKTGKYYQHMGGSFRIDVQERQN